jgi:hypothetical protein
MISPGSAGPDHQRSKGDEVRKLIVIESLALDGTAQAPGDVNEDTTGSFGHGGWHMRYGEGSGVQKFVDEAGGFVLGRRT